MTRSIVALVVLLCCATAAAAERPNVLFIAVDDLNDWIEPLGGRAGVITPNLSRLAALGTTFTCANTASPACHPSRVAMMTGVLPATSGVLENVFHDEVGPSWRGRPALADVPTISQHFRNNGYHAAGAGKIFHSLQWWPGSENDPATWDDYWPAAHQPIPFQPRPPESDYRRLQDDCLGTRPLKDALFGWEPLEVADEEMSDYQVVDWAIEQLAAEHTKPYFLACGLFRPHIPWEVPAKYYDLYPLDQLQLPGTNASDLIDTFGHKRRPWHAWVLANGQWPAAVRGYLASITFLDAQLGRLLNAYENSPLRNDTVLVLWSDHGMHIGEKENWEKFTLWEESCRVPLFFVAPGVTKPGTVCERPVTLTDVYPTLCELAGIAPPPHLEGESLLPLLREPETPRARPAITSNNSGDSFRTEHWRYILYRNGFEELYDHQSDPDEYTNLAYTAAHRSALDAHRELARKYLGRRPPEGYDVPPQYAADEQGRVRRQDYVPVADMVRKLTAGEEPSAAPTQREPFVPPEMTLLAHDLPPFEYVDVGPKIPNYTPSAQWGTQAAPLQQMQKPLPPEESRRHFVTPVGFEMRLFAAEPDIGGKPIAMAWDERGRLWVCETIDYPNELQPPGKGRDRVRICEDTDGDGRADRFTVFAEGLSIPTGILIYRGGAIVQNGVETLYLKDTDGDDRAEVREVLISNWTLGDTHGGVSNFQYGHDNWIWAMQGYNTSEPIVDGVKQQAFRMGFFRFRLTQTDPPRVTELEFLRSTNNNTWGLGISEEGLIFGSTANRNPSVYLPIANRYYERVRGWSAAQLGTIADTHLFRPITERVRQVDHHGGYTAGAGHALYTARRYPATWWNRTAFVCGPTGHLVGTFVLEADGADFHSTSPTNLVASDDEWTAPILAEVGPDGNVWIVDWYNYIVQHNPTPHGFQTGQGNAYESDLRDKRHGRIYRLVYTGGTQPNDEPFDLAQASADELVATLAHPTMLRRKHAQRLLVERGRDDVVPQLIALIRDPAVDAIGLNVGAIHALWTLQGLGALAEPSGEAYAAAIGALEHRSPGVRRNALQVLPPGEATTQAILQGRLLHDADAQVQLAALLALADAPDSPAAAEALATILLDRQTTGDPWLTDALTSAAATHAVPFLKTVAIGSSAARPRSAALGVVRIVAEHIARGQPSVEVISSLLDPLAHANPEVAAAVVAGLSAGWPEEFTLQLPPEQHAWLEPLLNRLPLSAQSELVRLSNYWGSRALEKRAAAIAAELAEVIADAGQSNSRRVEAARQLVGFRRHDQGVVDTLLEQVTPQSSPDLAERLIDALADSRAADLGPALVAHTSGMTPAARQWVVRVLLARGETTNHLLAALADGTLTASDLSLEQQQALANHPDRTYRRRAQELLRAAGGLPNPDRQKVFDERLALAVQSGSVEAGQAMFKKHCAKCHRHGTEGENIGPDLTGMAVHPKAELLLHILDPSRSVEGNFRIYSLVTTDGRVLSGMLAGETRTSLELIDAEAKRHAIQRSDIELLTPSPKSLMPEGFEKQMTGGELVDLLEFLTAKGRFVPLDLRRIATVSTARGMFRGTDDKRDAMLLPDWAPQTISGVPFTFTNPQGGRVPNAVLLHSREGATAARMPHDVTQPVNAPLKALHLLSGVSGWGYPGGQEGSVSMIVRLHYADGTTEDHALANGVHFATYDRHVDVPQSQYALDLRGRQLRYLAIEPQRDVSVREVQFLKGNDESGPVIMAATLETREPERIEPARHEGHKEE